MKLFRKKKIVLVLGGGAARGLANIGFLKVIERAFGRDNFPFDMIIGSSIGSLIGASYAACRDAHRIEKLATLFEAPKLVDLGLNPTGLLKGLKLESIINEMMDLKTFEDLKIPFGLTTTDIQTGEEFLHTSGDLIKLLRASCSWPGFFSSVEIDGKLLADGGLRNSIPTKFAFREGATLVVAVNPGFAITSKKIDNALKALVQSIQIMGEELNSYQSERADISVTPVLREIDQFDFDKAEYIIARGELATLRCLGEIKRKILAHRMLY